MSLFVQCICDVAFERRDIDELDAADAVASRYARAHLRNVLKRRDVRALLEILREDPAHVEALTALGALFLDAGQLPAARALLDAAVIHGPHKAMAHASLAYVKLLDNEPDAARLLFETALQLDPALAIAHHGLGELADRRGDVAEAGTRRTLALRHRALTLSTYRGVEPPLRILALVTAACGNIVTDGFFDSCVVQLASLIIDFVDPAISLPPHDLVFNIIGDGDLCAAQLAVAAAIIERSDAPVVNHPAAVAATTRRANASRLGRLDGVVTPRIDTIDRSELLAVAAAKTIAARGFTFPLLIRSPGYHRGEHFVRVDSPTDLAAAIAPLSGDELLLIEYLDLRDRAGNVCKYRVIIIDGTMYPLHLAISKHWKVHYFSADMSQSSENRARDQAFLLNMKTAIGARAVAALGRIRDALALDYGGIDFGLDLRGDVIVFEANASMTIVQPDAGPHWDYRRAPVARLRSAVREMLVKRVPPPG